MRRLWKKHVVDNLVNHLESNGFSIEMEMITKMARMNYACYSVPISYNSRKGSSNLKPVKDGIAILHAWLKNLLWKPKDFGKDFGDSVVVPNPVPDSYTDQQKPVKITRPSKT